MKVPTVCNLNKKKVKMVIFCVSGDENLLYYFNECV